MSSETFFQVCQFWAGIAILTFILLQFVKAPYGRHIKKGWGPEISNKWGWILMEAPSFFIILYFFVSSDQSSYASLLSLLWLIHYANRTFIFPIRIRTKGKKMPLVIVLSAVFFNLINAGLNGYFLAHFETYTTANYGSWNFLIGILLFFGGAWINQKSDTLLIGLRKPGEVGYKIPKGFLFDYISCPNHFGELIQWGGFALMALNCPATTFFLWTAANLIPRAMNHHKWYKKTFDEYPESRKAIIPGVL